MSLQVWLPLSHSNLVNHGIANVTITNSGATFSESESGYYFNGSSNRIQISLPTSMTTIKNTTVAAWVKSTGSRVALGGISHDSTPTYYDCSCTLYTSGWQTGTGSSWAYISGGTVANTNVWHHVACTISETNVTTYLDGIQVATKTLAEWGMTSFSLKSTQHFIEIGSDYPGGNEFLIGYVRDFRVYDECLNSGEVAKLANVVSGGLAVWLPLNKDNNVIADISSFSKESGITLTADSDEWYKVIDSSHASPTSRWGIYYDFVVKPNTTYTLCVYSKSPTGTLCSIAIGSFQANQTWPAVRDTNASSTEKLTTYTWTTTQSDKIARIYLAMHPTSTVSNNYVFYKKPRVLETLNNQGLKGGTVVTTGIIDVDSNGKFGKSYKTTNSGFIDLNYNGSQINTGSISFGGWFKFNKSELESTWSSYTFDSTHPYPTGNLIGNNTYGGVGLIWYTNSLVSGNSFTSLYTACSIRSTANGARITNAVTVPFDTWIHLMLVFNKETKKLQLWMNGELKSSADMLDFDDARSANLILNYQAVWGGNGPGYRIPFGVNDVRIYNYALSAEEVKELSRGLILHYPLNHQGWGQENLITNSQVNGSWTYPSSSYNDRYSSTTTIIPSGSTYTLSFYAKSTKAGDKVVTHYYSPNTTTGVKTNQGYTSSAVDGYAPFTLTTNWKRYWVVYTQSSTTSVKHLICPRLTSGNGTGTVSVRNVKFEEGDTPTPWCPNSSDALATTMGLNGTTEYDCSGLGNNGTRTGTFTWTSDTPKYPVSTKFSGTQYILSDSPSSGGETLSVWVKTTYAANQAFVIDYKSGLGIGFWNDVIIVSCNSNIKTTYSASNYTINEWNHIVVTKPTSTSILCYVNGILQSATSKQDYWSTGVMDGLSVAARPNGSSPSVCQLSDVRIYATALSAEDVLALYENRI